MEIRVLRYFLTVAREEGINRAAEALHITQPTLSRQLARLEEELGAKLFDRGARKIALTNEGILLRRRAEEILSLVDKTEQELAEQDELVEGVVTIGAGETEAVKILPRAIKSFCEKYPLVTFDIVTATADVVRERMERGLIDVGVLLEPVDMDKFDFIRLKTKERYVAIMRSSDPLAKKRSITAKDLQGKPLILPRRAKVRNELSSWFGASFKNQKIFASSNLSTNAAIMVHGGLGYAITIEGSLPFLDEKTIASRPLSPELCASCALAWKKQQPFPAAAAKFIEEINSLSGIGDI